MKKTNKSAYKKTWGMTLIEVLLVMGMTIFMLGLVIASYKSYNRKQVVVSATARLEQVFKEAKSNAAAGKVDCSVCGCTGTALDLKFVGWRVTLNTTSPGYVIQGLCGGLTFMTRSENFPGINITKVSTPGTVTSVTFKPNGQGTDLTHSFTIKPQQTDGTQLQPFLVTPAGEIISAAVIPTGHPIPTEPPCTSPNTCQTSCAGSEQIVAGKCSGSKVCCITLPTPIPPTATPTTDPLIPPTDTPEPSDTPTPTDTPVPTPTGAGVGLNGDYYTKTTFTVPASGSPRTDSTVAFDWGTTSPIEGILANKTYSVRWTGGVQPLTSGPIDFWLNFRGTVTLWVNDQNIIPKTTNNSGASIKGTIPLDDGSIYPIQLDFVKGSTNGMVYLEWDVPWQANQVIPADRLYLPGTF